MARKSSNLGGRPSRPKGQTATIRHHHLSYLRELGAKIGSEDMTECLNYALNVLRSGQYALPQSIEATPETPVKSPDMAPDMLDDAALASELYNLV